MTSRRAARVASHARRLRGLPVCSAAAVAGTLSGGQVEAIVAVLDDATTVLFAEHEAELVPRLADLTVKGVALAMATWKARATAVLPDPPQPAEPARSLHLSPTLGGRYEPSGSSTALWNALVVRDEGCRFPDCDRVVTGRAVQAGVMTPVLTRQRPPTAPS